MKPEELRRVYLAFSCLLSWMITPCKLMTRDEAEAVEDSWDEIFDWLSATRDMLKPHVDEARGSAK